jgi:hypothetical protein
MASILKVDALQGVTAAGSILVTGEGNSTTTNLQEGLAKIRVSYNQSSGGAQGIYGSFNITSYADAGTGLALITFTNNFANTGYSPVGSGHMKEASNVTVDMFVYFAQGGGTYTTSAFNVTTYRNGVGAVDNEVGIIGHGDLA